MTLRVKAVRGAPIEQVVSPGPATFAMVEKAALFNLDALMKADIQAARLIVSLIRLMEPHGSGVVVISRTGMAEMMGVSLPTIQRALKTLTEGRWVQRIKIGGAYALAINRSVAWVGPRGAMAHATFGATVIAARSEQDSWALSAEPLKRLPLVHPGETPLAIGQEPEPPYQPSLDGVDPAVAVTRD
jgi:hypothetical protein